MSSTVIQKTIGGSHLTSMLMDCLRVQGFDMEVVLHDFTELINVLTNIFFSQIDEANIDSSQVKRECYLAYNPLAEGKKKLPQKTLSIKGTK
jgi:hypothetical protein